MREAGVDLGAGRDGLERLGAWNGHGRRARRFAHGAVVGDAARVRAGAPAATSDVTVRAHNPGRGVRLRTREVPRALLVDHLLHRAAAADGRERQQCGAYRAGAHEPPWAGAVMLIWSRSPEYQAPVAASITMPTNPNTTSSTT